MTGLKNAKENKLARVGSCHKQLTQKRIYLFISTYSCIKNKNFSMNCQFLRSLNFFFLIIHDDDLKTLVKYVSKEEANSSRQTKYAR